LKPGPPGAGIFEEDGMEIKKKIKKWMCKEI